MLSDTWISGTVVRGNGFGRKLGFPTANLELMPESERPREGIYAGWVKIGEENFKGALHVGPRPAVNDFTATIEVHILDFDGRDLYGQRISLGLVKRLRDVKDFDSLDDLRQAIAEDCAQAGRYLAAS